MKFNLDTHTNQILTKSFSLTFMKLASMFVGFLISIYLGRTLGPDGLGAVNLVNKIVIILLVFTMFGFEHVIIKFISIDKAENDIKKISSHVKTSLLFNFSLSILISSLGFLFLFFFEEFNFKEELYLPLFVVFLIIIPKTIAKVFSSALNGISKIWQSIFVDQIIIILLVAFGLSIAHFFEISLNIQLVLGMYLASYVLAAFIAYCFWQFNVKVKINGIFELKPMIKMAKPLLLIGSAGVIVSNIDVIMLGLLGTITDVGIYSVSSRLSLLVSFFLTITNTAIAPKIASLYNSLKIKAIKILVKRITMFLTLAAFILLILFMFYGKWLLAFWGEEFVAGYQILIVLAVSQFFNMATGCSGLLLIMSGHEKIHGLISIYSLVLNIILNLILIKTFGALGIAIATSIVIILENIFKVILAKRKTGILTIPSLNLD